MSDLSYKPKFENGIIAGDVEIKSDVALKTVGQLNFYNKDSRIAAGSGEIVYRTSDYSGNSISGREYSINITSRPLDNNYAYVRATSYSLDENTCAYLVCSAKNLYATSSINSQSQISNSACGAIVLTSAANSEYDNTVQIQAYNNSTSKSSSINVFDDGISVKTDKLAIANHVANAIAGLGYVYNASNNNLLSSSLIGKMYLCISKVAQSSGVTIDGSNLQIAKISASSSTGGTLSIAANSSSTLSSSNNYRTLNACAAGGLVLVVRLA